MGMLLQNGADGNVRVSSFQFRVLGHGTIIETEQSKLFASACVAPRCDVHADLLVESARASPASPTRFVPSLRPSSFDTRPYPARMAAPVSACDRSASSL